MEEKREIEKDIFGGDLVNMAVTVPLGYRFVPTELELVRGYLLKKLKNQPLSLPSGEGVIEYDLYNTEPWNLPVNNIDNCAHKKRRSYYFVRTEKNNDKRLCDGNRVKHMVKCGDRTSKSIVGYWKRNRRTPHDKLILDERKQTVGIMKAFSFYFYTPNNDNEWNIINTGWIMREYTLNSLRSQPFVLCSVINKSPFNISPYYLDKNHYVEGIDPDEAEQIGEGFKEAFLAMIQRK